MRRKQNLIDLKSNFIYACIFLFVVGAHTIKNAILEIFYEEIGNEMAFQIWSYIYIIENIGI